MIKVLIVDDSPSAAEYIETILSSDPEFSVIGKAGNGAEGIRMAKQLKPDIISMDFNMPDMDGFNATRIIMSSCPAPIVIVSSIYDKHAITMSFKSLGAGALAILPKPPSMVSPDYLRRKQELLLTFKAMAGVKVIRRTAFSTAPSPAQSAIQPSAVSQHIRLIAIGASTGGPQVIQEILSLLPTTLHIPIVVVQHITPGFEAGFADWLNQTTGFTVSVATSNELLKDNCVHIAPEGKHLEVTRDGRIILVPGPVEHGVCPSISRFFRSVARSYGNAAIGVLLTGMGTDGSAELRLLKDTGAITIAQDKASSVVHGMPGEAIRLGGACHILPAKDMAATISSIIFHTEQPKLNLPKQHL